MAKDPNRAPPRWVVSNERSLKREAEDYIGMTPSQRAAIVDLLCRDAYVLLSARADRERILNYRDPMPASTTALMARLRAQQRAARGHGD